MRIEIDKLPPSVNSMYRMSKYGCLYLTSDAKKFKEELGWIAKNKKKDYKNKKIKIELVFKINDNRKRDLDNLFKATLDSLKGIIFDDDDQILRIDALKMKGLKNKTIINISNLLSLDD